MTEIQHLGRLEKVHLREIWAREDNCFTPWLACEENINLLGTTIGISLEVEGQEKEVGPFRADILCKDTLTDEWVLIENQLERTDHTHLGQLLTYASGLKAVTVVWIAQRFTDEHRAAMDWLNEITHEGFRFFALEVEAWRIGDSEAAPKFNVVSKPNDWSREVAGSAGHLHRPDLTPRTRLQLEFWTAFKVHTEEHARRICPIKPQATNYLTMAIGHTGFHLSAVACRLSSGSGSSSTDELRAELVIVTNNARDYLDRLREDSEHFEEAMGSPLEWRGVDGVKKCRIFLRRPANLEERTAWPEYHAWLTDQLDRLHEVFQQRIKALEPASGERAA